MPKLKFTKDDDGDFSSKQIVDGEGDTFNALVMPNAESRGDYFITFNVNSEVAGLSSEQAVTLALRILKEATR